MNASEVNFAVVQGEDWSTQAFFQDSTEEPLPLTNQVKMEIINYEGQTIHTLETSDVPVDFQTEKPSIVVSEDIGLVQLHIPRATTEGFAPGNYRYDLFAKLDDGGAYAGDQALCLLRGNFQVAKRITGSF